MKNTRWISLLDIERARHAKRSYTTRRVPVEDMDALVSSEAKPTSGDLVLARVERIGHHAKLELTDGRRAQLYAGDEIIVCYGNRYATDQFEARVSDDLSSCNLAAAGGIAGVVRAHHDRARRPTEITPLGLVADRAGHRLNLHNYALPPAETGARAPAIVVVGTGMNAGKTTTAAHIVKGLARAGYRVGTAKVTGTGAGNDLWAMIDAGAHDSLDFIDLGHASTYMMSPREVEQLLGDLLGHLSARGANIAVLEIADGLLQKETMALLGSARLRAIADTIMLVAQDSVGAAASARPRSMSTSSWVAMAGRTPGAPISRSSRAT